MLRRFAEGSVSKEQAMAALHAARVNKSRALLSDALQQPSGVNAGNEIERDVRTARHTCKAEGVKLLPHEQELLEKRELKDITHPGASAIWLHAESFSLEDERLVLVYRPMGDEECRHLLTRGALPDTHPYQTIVVGHVGRMYAEKYLRGRKSVDSSPTTVVEFMAPRALIQQLFAMQSKNEDGAISHGLGSKGGRGLPFFNASLENGETCFRIVLVKRFEKKAIGAFGAGRKRL